MYSSSTSCSSEERDPSGGQEEDLVIVDEEGGKIFRGWLGRITRINLQMSFFTRLIKLN